MKFFKNVSLLFALIVTGSMLIYDIPVVNNITPTEMAYAKSFGGGSRSFGGSSRSFSSSKSSSSWGSKSSSKPSNSGWGSSKKSAPVTTNREKAAAVSSKSTVDNKLAAKAKSNGTLFKSKETALLSFKNDPKMQSKYTGKYSSQPATRPKHIPEKYTDGQGNTYNVTYNQDKGGYGYQSSSGWIGFDPMSMLSGAMLYSLMSDNGNNYYVQSPNTTAAAPLQYEQRSHGTAETVFLIIFLVIITVLVIGGIAVMLNN